MRLIKNAIGGKNLKGPLGKYRILDLSQAIAGPYGSMLLADLGAEVIKIEPPISFSHTTGGATGHKGESFFYLAFNRNKKGITLDLGTDLGKETFYELVKISDVVYDNFRPGVMERLGADYETLKKIKPNIISTSISGFGSSGPYSDRPGVDMVVLGLSGIMSITGEPGRKPVRPGPPIGDLIGGMFGALGTSSALTYREATGQGQKVDIGLLDGCISLLAYHLSYYECSGIVPKALGSGHLALVPFGVYKCKEGYICIGSAWPRLAKVVGAEWMIEDPRFKDTDERSRNRDEFDRILETYLAQATADEWLDLLNIEDIPAGPVNTIAQAAHDPQVLYRNMVLNLPHILGGSVKLAGNPVKMPVIDESEYTAPPVLGQHNDEILVGLLGYSKDKIQKMREEEKEHQGELLPRLTKTHGDRAATLLEQRAERDSKENKKD